jgi:transcriptional regulator of heat shock response
MARKDSTTQLNERAQDVLKVLIQEFVQDGKPVGSRRLAKNYWEKLMIWKKWVF